MAKGREAVPGSADQRRPEQVAGQLDSCLGGPEPAGPSKPSEAAQGEHSQQPPRSTNARGGQWQVCGQG
jgi:hypothetical protein